MKLSKEEREFLISLISDYELRCLLGAAYFDFRIVNSLLRKLKSNINKSYSFKERKYEKKDN